MYSQPFLNWATLCHMVMDCSDSCVCSFRDLGYDSSCVTSSNYVKELFYFCGRDKDEIDVHGIFCRLVYWTLLSSLTLLGELADLVQIDLIFFLLWCMKLEIYVRMEIKCWSRKPLGNGILYINQSIKEEKLL